MTAAAQPRLLQEFLECRQVGILDKASKDALRLCSKQIKDYVDAAIIACKVKPYSLNALLNCNWPLKEIEILGYGDPEMSPASFTSLLFDLIRKFPLLHRLFIGNVKELVDLPENIGELSNLKEFSVNGGYGLKVLPTSFGQLTTLEELELDECGLDLDRVDPLTHLKNLKSITITGDIARNPLFPEWLCSCDFPLLEHLDVGLELSTFPPCLTNFKNLTKLDLKFGEVDLEIKVPESIGALTSLQGLSLSSLYHISLPDSLSKLTTLEELEFSAQTDSEDIAPIEYLTGLTKLELSKFHTEDPSDGYLDFLCNLTLLKELVLYDSNVFSLPDALGNLKNLESLTLGGLNHLEELPESIGALSSLTKLNIYACQRLKRLPNSIGNLAVLDDLFLGDCNELERLPESIGNLNALEVLAVVSCRTLHIPDSFADLILGKPYEDWSLKRVRFLRCEKMVLSQKAEQALALLKEHGVWDPM